MSGARVAFTGLEELRQALRTLPDRLADEAGGIVQVHAYTAAQAVRDAYNAHRRTGNLADTVVVETADHGRFGVGMVVRAKAKHAWLFDHGTQARHTAIGANRGSMPAQPTFIPAVMKFRRAMYVALADMLRREGLVVSGNAG